MDDVGPVYHIQCFPDIVISDQNAEPMVFQLAYKISDFVESDRINASKGFVEK